VEHPVIEFRNVTKRFGEVVAVVENNLAVRAGEFLSILAGSRNRLTSTIKVVF
jgi:ABC-type Fe3+/spermidine/putrescine transport system ATPase subunit